jgi:hypothetical protein
VIGMTSRTPADDPRDTTRHLALIVEALLANRPTIANDRFDAEVAVAVEQGQLEPATARALRYRQRASVRAVETYLQDTLGPILETQRNAARQALADVEDDDVAWEQAAMISALPAEPKSAEPEFAEPGFVAPESAAVRLAVVPDLDQPTRVRTAAETKAAIRAALQS